MIHRTSAQVCASRLPTLLSLLLLAVASGGAAAQGGEVCPLAWSAAFQGSGPAGTTPQVRDMIVFDDGTGPALYVVGSFTSFDGVPALNVARWDGAGWSDVGGGIGGGSIPGFLHALEIFDDGRGPALYAGGLFVQASGQPAQGIVRWDGAQWIEVGGGLRGQTPIIFDMITFDDGDGSALYIAGRFEVAGGINVNSIARWDGRAWTRVGGGVTGITNEIRDMDLLSLPSADGGSILVVGGRFTFAGGTPASNVARWDGHNWHPLGNGIGGDFPFVFAVKSFSSGGDELLYVGGQFEEAGDEEIRNLAAWAGGDTWLPVGDPLGPVSSLDTWHDGRGEALYIAGSFFQIDGRSVQFVTRHDGSHFERLGSAVDNPIAVVRGLSDEFAPALYVAGSFETAGGEPAAGFARWGCFGTADLDGDGIVGFPDLLRLLTEWGACPAPPESCPGDLNGDGDIGFADLVILLSAW